MEIIKTSIPGVLIIELDTKLNMATNPPTTLYIPKSVTPNALRIIRDVNNPITIMTIIRKYNATAFFAIFLLFVTSCDIKIKNQCIFLSSLNIACHIVWQKRTITVCTTAIEQTKDWEYV